MTSAALIGNRIPRDYFITKGGGESDITIHAGSYHLALREAGIEMANIMTYSSILPREATEVDAAESKSRIVHGEVMESIMAVAHATKGGRATAGIIFGWLHDAETGERYGGLVCEYNGGFDGLTASTALMSMLGELHQNGYEHFQLRDVEMHLHSVEPEKEFGTALVAICFISYEVPLFSTIERREVSL